MAGSPDRIRPHVKTHKTAEIVRLCLEVGVTKHKCATLAEAELLASCSVPDVLIAYPLVGPNPARLARLAGLYPSTRFAVTVDHREPVEALERAFQEGGATVDVLLDLDVGQHRTGLAPGPEAVALYRQIAGAKHLRPGGLHVYDGHNHQGPVGERREAGLAGLDAALTLRRTLEGQGLPVPRLVVGGTPTFPVYAPARPPARVGVLAGHLTALRRQLRGPLPGPGLRSSRPAAHPRHQPTDAHARDLRPRLQSRR